MTKDDLIYLIQLHKELEFQYKGKTYSLNYDTDSNGKPLIVFGRQYEGERYSSYGEFINNAKIENSYFREILEDIPKPYYDFDR